MVIFTKRTLKIEPSNFLPKEGHNFAHHSAVHCTKLRFERISSCGNLAIFKGQLISKAIYGLLTSPKKQTDEFVLFAFLLFTANKSNSSVHFLGESSARQSAFRFYLTFSTVTHYLQQAVLTLVGCPLVRAKLLAAA